METTARKPALDAALEQLVADLEASFDEATGKWKPCWRNAGLFPHNAITGRNYQGMNTILLWAEQVRHGYTDTRWATYKQWQSINGQITKGQHGTACVKWVDVNATKANLSAAEPKRAKMMPLVFIVFNAAQVSGIESLGEADSMPEFIDWYDGFMGFLEPIPVTIITGEPAYYPRLDHVECPPAGNFDSVEDWAHVLCHELGHWTGHASRLNRQQPSRHVVLEAYAFEELVAEISSHLTTSFLQIPGEMFREDHVIYIKSWLTALKQDPGILMSAAMAAQRATNHLLSYSQPKEIPDASTTEQSIAS